MQVVWLGISRLAALVMLMPLVMWNLVMLQIIQDLFQPLEDWLVPWIQGRLLRHMLQIRQRLRHMQAIEGSVIRED